MKLITRMLAPLLLSGIILNACTNMRTASKPAPGQQPVKGTVEDIQRGKDGYTAKIKTESGQYYFVTVSRVNLKDPAQYKDAATGAVIEVTGDAWSSEGEKHITARTFQKQ